MLLFLYLKKFAKPIFKNFLPLKARLQIISDLYDLGIDKRSSNEEIKQGALILLNNIYRKRTGMTYEEIIKEVKK